MTAILSSLCDCISGEIDDNDSEVHDENLDRNKALVIL